MKRCKTLLVCVCLIFLAVVPAYCQRGTFGIDVGDTADRFASLPSVNGLEFGIDGQLAVFQANPKTGRPAIVAGGEIRLPTDTGNHAREYAVFGGPEFNYHNFVFGVHVQVRKIDLPAANVDNQVFARDSLRLVELPIVIKYKFGPAKKAFAEVQGAPEFSPHYRHSSASLVSLPNPNFDHGYFVRGSVGYTFGNWYAKGTYETRYFKFVENAGNPSNLYSWKSNLISGGVGFSF
jgi:hypothetical protein